MVYNVLYLEIDTSPVFFHRSNQRFYDLLMRRVVGIDFQIVQILHQGFQAHIPLFGFIYIDADVDFY